MKKQYQFKGKTALITVSLFHVNQKRPHGISFHKAKIEGSGFFKEKEFSEKANLEDEVIELERDFQNFIETPVMPLTKEEKILQDLGFE